MKSEILCNNYMSYCIVFCELDIPYIELKFKNIPAQLFSHVTCEEN